MKILWSFLSETYVVRICSILGFIASFKQKYISLYAFLCMRNTAYPHACNWYRRDIWWSLDGCTGFLLGWNFFRTICPGCQRSTGHLQFLQDNFSWTINWNLKVRLIVFRKRSTLMAKSGNVLHTGSLLLTQPMLCLIWSPVAPFTNMD